MESHEKIVKFFIISPISLFSHLFVRILTTIQGFEEFFFKTIKTLQLVFYDRNVFIFIFILFFIFFIR